MDKYLSEIQSYFQDENSSEHSYRTSFENYLKEIFPKEKGYLTQQDQRAINGNKPDFVILKGRVPVLYIEVKKVGESLDKVEKSEQADRYFGYDNLIISDYVNFRLFRNGQKYNEEISLGDIDKNNKYIKIREDNSKHLTKTIQDFVSSHKESIKSGIQLARIMGGKAQRIRENVSYMIQSRKESSSDLFKILDVVKQNLIANLDDKTFADMYAQTLVYGLFVARYNDKTPENFSRIEARDLVPKSNPFLRSFFDHITGNTFPDQLKYIVDELCEVFQHADVEKLLSDFYGKEKENKDPVIHFYEDFLKEYDAKKKMEMGVFYTPRPVVQFIVRAVDDILKSEFGLTKGLADTTKIKKDKIGKDAKGKEIKVPVEYHKVQVLDIATGTGTFLNEVIHKVYQNFKDQEGSWQSYVENDLLPRLHGFELMMASYTIAHLKLGMTLHDTGVKDLDKRIGVYLTNTLEAPALIEIQPSMFGVMESIVEERKSASKIKSEYPIMCVIGNPPYSVQSMNPDYISQDVYKVEPGGNMKLKEKNSKMLNDDYVKFIRFAEDLIEKNEEGILGMITAHGYINNSTFRGMRWHLRNTFTKIYILDLHGNSRKKEVTPSGSKDDNVFDIMTGVSIILGFKKSDLKNKKLATVYKSDLYGLRQEKFEKLDNYIFNTIKWVELPDEHDVWVLEGEGKEKYKKGFSIAEMFPVNSVGVTSSKDEVLINSNVNILLQQVKENYKLEPEEEFVRSIAYRPFDIKNIYYNKKFVGRPRLAVMQHLKNENISLIFEKIVPMMDASVSVFISKNLSDGHLTGARSYVAPLYIHKNDKIIPNLNKEMWRQINNVVGEVTPENIFDYIYAVLHSPKYRETYKEFLKIDFPRVPYPKDKKHFEMLVRLGNKLRELHLMIDPECEKLITKYSIPGGNIVDKVKYKDGNVYINDSQYFEDVPEISWNFYIGGYQPAQKYLKDRKGNQLTHEEIEHYQKIIKVLFETDKIMQEIDKDDL